jgi:hypothetical protein
MLEDSEILNSPVSLLHPIPAKFGDGTPIVIQNISTAANFLLTSCLGAKTTSPDLWAVAEDALAAANESPTDTKKAQVAWLAVYNLLAAVNRLA